MAPKPINNTLPLVVIVGPTASGKTALAIELAQRFNGEIICADSRTIYTGMDIGTAKPSKADQALVPHWGLDLIEPGERYTAADFKGYADERIFDIRARGKVPFLVGGTGLYVDSVIYNYKFKGSLDVAKRATLDKMTVEELHEYCMSNNVPLPENKLNKRYVVRVIETHASTRHKQQTLVSNTIIVGITTNRDQLRTRIHDRSEHLFNSGVVQEANLLGKKYGWNSEAMTSNVYRVIHEYNTNKISYTEMKGKCELLDWRLAKRQITWHKRNTGITWLSLVDANTFLSSRLAK